jgi:hypothetical protein
VLEAGDDVVRMSPPLVISASDVDTAVRILSESVDYVARDPQAAYREASRWLDIHQGEVDG